MNMSIFIQITRCQPAIPWLLLLMAAVAAPAQAQTTRYVDGVNGNDQTGSNDCESQAFPCRTLSHAVETSFGGDILRIANAVYTESLNIDRPLTLRGESETGTIIQAHAQPGQATSRVITIDGDLEVVISRMTIRHGVAGGTFPDSFGGGLFTRDAALTMSHVTFSGNDASSGGGIGNIGGTLTLTNVAFSGNTGDGGGMYNRSSSPILTNVSFSGNSAGLGGGMFNQNGSSPALTNVSFSGNDATSRGGGMLNDGSTPTLTNVSFSGNSAGLNGGGISNYIDASIILRNSIVWGNTASRGNEIYNREEASAELHYSLHGADPDDIVQGGGFTATHSLIADPLFVDADNGNLRLAADSPAVDMGAPATDPSLFPGGPDHPVDLDGNPRFSNAAIDIGAYEFTNTLFQDRFEQ